MLVVSRFTVPDPAVATFHSAATALLQAAAGSPGYLRGQLGRSPDDPAAWVVVTEWTAVGWYRRSLSSYAVRVASGPLQPYADPGPGAYEVLVSDAVERGSDRAADAASVGVGEAAGPAARPPGG